MKYLIIVLFCLFLVPQVSAFDQSKPNNKFGIHLAQPDTETLKKAAELVNTHGDWGYVTLVLQENDRDKGKWQNIFNELRKLHLIPIIRLATQPEGAAWRRPTQDDIDGWVNFLDSLNWVVKDRYIVLFNEPNHGAEWGGEVDPVNFREVTLALAKKLKEKNQDFFIMLAGMDASAPSARPSYEDEEVFLSQVFTGDTIKDWNEVLSGLASHSYPNPGFAGSPYGIGRGSIQNYRWELDLLSRYGVKKLPVFITETGWDGAKISRIGVANHFQTAYESIWLPDNDVVAVTPFVLDYQTEPFLHFSWRMQGSDDYYDQFYTVKDLAKQSGKPEIKESGSLAYELPKELVVNSSYQFKIDVTNTGQAFWDHQYDYHLDADLNFAHFFSDISDINPFEDQELQFVVKTGSKPEKKTTQLYLMHGDDKILTGPEWSFEVVPLPSLDFNVSLYPRLKNKGTDFEIQVFDENQKLIYKRKNIAVEHTKGSITEVQNVVLNKPYRVVILKPYYLPRQTFVSFKKGANNASFERMYPLDFNLDGALTYKDLVTLIQNPQLFTLLLP